MGTKAYSTSFASNVSGRLVTDRSVASRSERACVSSFRALWFCDVLAVTCRRRMHGCLSCETVLAREEIDQKCRTS